MADRLVELVQPQKTFFNHLCEALRAEKESIWMAILSLRKELTPLSPSINESLLTPQGCLLMSTLFHFKVSSIQPLVSHSKVFVDHLSGLQGNKTRFFSDIGPGRMLQSLISRQSCFPSNMKNKIIRHIMLSCDSVERLSSLANDRKVGAWLVTTAWDSSDMETKRSLGEALLQIEGLRDSNWKIWKHCGLATFSRRKDDWVHNETKKEKTQGFLREIVGENYQPKKKHRS
jgi:hypothetical protein